jgi:uncharacterized membrane protein YciS (DUF1049 family)
MKYLAIIMILLSVAVVAGAQEFRGRYLLIYRCEGNHFVSTPPPADADPLVAYGHYEIETRYKIFLTLDEMLGWLNVGTLTMGNHAKVVRLQKEDIIAIYDLSTAKKVELELKTEEVVKPKRVEVQEERWTNEEWRVK